MLLFSGDKILYVMVIPEIYLNFYKISLEVWLWISLNKANTQKKIWGKKDHMLWTTSNLCVVRAVSMQLRV